MKKPVVKVENSMICAMLIGLCLVITGFTFVINFNQFVMPHIVFKAILITCAIVSAVCYGSFIYFKFSNFDKSVPGIVFNITKMLLLGIVVYFIITFPLAIMSNSN